MKLTLILSLLTWAFVACASSDVTTPVRTVESVDVARYMGRWYEITRFPNSFQKKCLATKAEYGLRSDGKVTVKNTCKTTKGDNVANALARVVDKKTNAKLKVSFVPFFNRFGWFAGDYWILDLAADYSYVLVGSPDRNFLWVLSRTPTLDANIVEALKTTAQKEGFDVSRLVETPVWAE
jgi:apolipoprotein D and lipocalin family protein